MGAALGIMGKHPAFGDFVQAGLTEKTTSTLSLWLDRSLSQLRDQMTDGWPRFWDNGQVLRFWIGSAVTGATLAGILQPSRDRVGRRFPLLLIAEGAAIDLPMQTPDQGIWETMEAHLLQVQPRNSLGAKSLLDGLDLFVPAAEQDPNPMLWAHRPDGDLTALLRAAGRADPASAALPRSYWWVPGDDSHAALWLGCDGLPAAQALGWLLGGVEKEVPEADTVRTQMPVEGG